MRSLTSALLLALPLGVLAQDPASSWLAYAVARGNGTIVTYVNATWTVPAFPSSRSSPSAPGWWFGIEPNPANYLIQPILAYGDGSNDYTIFNGEYDWPEGNWWSSDSFTVQPGDVIFASLSYVKASNAYEMVISNNNKAGAVIKSLRPVIDNQVYTDVYFVTEHQPDSCTEYPANGGIVFSNIIIAWDNQQATPQWSAHQFQPACNSQAHILSSSSVSFTWSTS